MPGMASPIILRTGPSPSEPPFNSNLKKQLPMNATTKNIMQLLLVASVSLTSCKKLDVAPPDKISSSIFWKSESDADLALTGIYNRFYAPSTQAYIPHYLPFCSINYSYNPYPHHTFP